MKILHLSACDYGGAGMAAFRFHKDIAARGIDSRMLVLAKRTEDTGVIPIAKPGVLSRTSILASKAILKLRSNPDYYFQDQTKSALDTSVDYLDEMGYQPDLIVAHWISNFVSLDDLYRMSAGKNIPVIWYMMDMAPLTGGCHYAWDCVGYTKNCGNCPALYSGKSSDLSSEIWMKKHACIQRMNITVVAGSWLINHAEKAGIFQGKRKKKIMLGVDAEVFRPRTQADARQALNLPAGKKILFAGSQSMRQRRKGMKYFQEAVNTLENDGAVNKKDIVILTAGDITAKKSLRNTAFEHIHLGMLNENGLLKAYQAADVFVCPSIEDAGPMMIKESIMCGTPVVSFEMGAAVDLVRTGITGYCAALMDSNDLAKGIMQILNLNPVEAEKMSGSCRDIGLRLSSEETQVSAFINLASEIVEQSRSS